MIALLLAFAWQPAPFPPASPTAPASLVPHPVPDADMREMAAIVGRQMAGHAVSGRYANADKLLLLTRDDKGQPAIGASFALPASRSLPEPPAGTLAVVRAHRKMLTVVPGPNADDLAFVAAYKIPLYVVGEWARPAPVWEIALVGGNVRYRAIGEVGEIGPWQN